MYAQQQDQAFMPPCEGVHGPCATMARSQIMLRKGVPMSIDRSPYARFSENPTPFPEHLRRLNLSVGVVQYLKEGVPKGRDRSPVGPRRHGARECRGLCGEPGSEPAWPQ